MQRVSFKKTNDLIEIHILAQQDYAFNYTVILALWSFVGIVSVYLLTIIVNSYFLIPIAFLVWIMVFCLLLLLATWHLSGVEIIKLTRDSLEISREINAFSYKQSFATSEITNFVVPTLSEKLYFDSIKNSICNKSIYKGNVAFQFDNKDYSFAYQVSYNDSVDIVTALNEFLNQNDSI